MELNLQEQIFVGRQKELSTLQRLWNFSLSSGEHIAYVFFNAPGVGKTTLIRKFGNIIEKEKLGIHFHYVCRSSIQSRVALEQDLLEHISDFYLDKYEQIMKYVQQHYTGFKKKMHEERLDRIYNRISENLQTKDYGLEVVSSSLHRLSLSIPIFFSSDEVQVFEQIKLKADDYNSEETLFHYYTKLIAELLNAKILLIMTGTQYHILRKIGDKIGSPIRDKVESKIISPLSSNDITDYSNKLKALVPDVNQRSLDYLHIYLQIFSGGHARTITKIVNEFVNGIKKYETIAEYSEFKEQLTESLESVLINTDFTTEKTTAIKQLQSKVQFNTVRKWYIAGIFANLSLGSVPRTDSLTINQQINDVVYSLMTVGVLVQNGNNDYYITSYFHYLTFLQAIIGEYENFLLEVINNKFFRMLVGGHSGFGYSYENILLATMIVKSSKSQNFPFQISKVVQIKQQVQYQALPLEQGVMYHTPDSRNIDAIALINDDIIVFQITTESNVRKSKLDKFAEELGQIRKITGKQVKGYFVSLFAISAKIPAEITVVQGTDLVKLMGENIYNTLLQTKSVKINL